MKSKGILITVIVLLSVWSVIATVGFVSAEKDNRLRLAKYSMVKSSYEDKEEAYDKLKKDYDDLEKDRDKWKDKYLDSNAYYTFHLAYEWLFDMLANSNNPNYDADAALDEICEREGLSLLSKSYVLKEAQKILQEYGIETE